MPSLRSARKGIIMPKPSSKKLEKSVEELTYEEALVELEGIVSALEGEQNQLEEAIKLFERGQALASRCSILLEAAELKVKQVAGDELIPFEDLSE
jgi:exodeoxyribonuclease VII small subunit